MWVKTGDKVGEIGKGTTSLVQEFEVYPDGKGTEDFKQNSEWHDQIDVLEKSSQVYFAGERGWETGKLTQGSEDNDGETRMVLKDILEIEHPGFGLECDVLGGGQVEQEEFEILSELVHMIRPRKSSENIASKFSSLFFSSSENKKKKTAFGLVSETYQIKSPLGVMTVS